MNKYKKEDIIPVKHPQLTWGELKEFCKDHNIPDDAPIMIQRVEDRYYDGIDVSGMTGTLPDGTSGILPPGSKADGWRVYLKKGFWYYSVERQNEKMEAEIKRRKNGEEPHYDKIENPEDCIVDLNDDELFEQYTPASQAVFYSDDSDMLFIDLHY